MKTKNLDVKTQNCCMSDDTERDGHAGDLRCARTADCPLAFETGSKDCIHWTCAKDAETIQGVLLCKGCACELKETP